MRIWPSWLASLDQHLIFCIATGRPVASFQNKKGAEAPFAYLARPERFELPTTKFVAWYSIQLSYGREEAELFRRKRVSSTPDIEQGSVARA